MVVAVMSRSFVFGMDVSDVSCASASTSAVAELALTPGNNIQMLRWFEERSPQSNNNTAWTALKRHAMSSIGLKDTAWTALERHATSSLGL